MKAFLRTIRSMKFSLILIIPLLVLFLLGSIIPQGETEAYYQATYPNFYHLILGFALNSVFSSPAFLLLAGLFSINLLFCTIWQFRTVSKQRIGSALTHAALLLIFLGGLGLYLFSSVEDRTVMPGETITLEDGTNIEVDSFRVTDDTGAIDYASILQVTDPDGRESGQREVKVNSPLRFGNHKYYQQSYGVAGKVTISIPNTEIGQNITMTQQGFITLNGTNGIWYEDVYPGYTLSEDGEYTLITETSGEYTDPIYYIIWVQDGVTTPMLILPGETLEAEDGVYSFEEPVLYPGIRIKTTPTFVYIILYSSFVLLIIGLYLCFFKNSKEILSVKGENYYNA